MEEIKGKQAEIKIWATNISNIAKNMRELYDTIESIVGEDIAVDLVRSHDLDIHIDNIDCSSSDILSSSEDIITEGSDLIKEIDSY